MTWEANIDSGVHLRSYILLQYYSIFLNIEGAQESISSAYVSWRASTTTLFLLGP
jgi:hypothetical protein